LYGGEQAQGPEYSSTTEEHTDLGEVKTYKLASKHRTTLSFVCNHNHYPPSKGCEGGGSRGGDKGAIWLEGMHVWQTDGVGDMPKTKLILWSYIHHHCLLPSPSSSFPPSFCQQWGRRKEGSRGGRGWAATATVAYGMGLQVAKDDEVMCRDLEGGLRLQ